MPTALEQPAPTFQDVWRMFQETDRQMKETDRKIKQLSTEIGNLGNRLGDFVQGIVKPGLEELFQQRGLTVHRTMQNLESRDDAGQMLSEVDLLVIDSVVAVAVECKSNLSLDDVKDHPQPFSEFQRALARVCTLPPAGRGGDDGTAGGCGALCLPQGSVCSGAKRRAGRNTQRRALYAQGMVTS